MRKRSLALTSTLLLAIGTPVFVGCSSSSTSSGGNQPAEVAEAPVSPQPASADEVWRKEAILSGDIMTTCWEIDDPTAATSPDPGLRDDLEVFVDDYIKLIRENPDVVIPQGRSFRSRARSVASMLSRCGQADLANRVRAASKVLRS
jgi:hypothetical protein